VEGPVQVIIGVMTDPYSLGTIGLAAYSTWGREASQFANVRQVSTICMQRLIML
jgi:hypothetical protein